MLADQLRPLTHKITSFPLWSSNSAIPNTSLETLSWVLSIKTNVALGLLLALVASLLLPGIPYTNVIFLIAGAVVYLAVTTVARSLLRGTPSDKLVRTLTEVLIPLEVTFSTADIYFTGGALTPMFIVYTLSIMMSIILLSPLGVYRITALSIVQYCALTILEASGIIPRIPAVWNGKQLYAEISVTNYAAYLMIVCCTLAATAYMGNRIARVIKERNERIRRQMADLSAIYSISHKLGNMTSDVAVAEYLAPTLREIHDATISLITFANNNGGTNIVTASGLSLTERNILEMSTYTDVPGFHELLDSGEPLVIHDTKKLTQYVDLIPEKKINSLYAFPMLVEGKLLGTICICLPQRNALSEEYRDLLKTIANQAGVAIQRARLFQHTQRLANEMSALYDVGLHTGSTLSISEVVKRTANNMEKLMHSSTCYVALYDAQSDTVTFEHFKDHGEFMPVMKVPVGPEGIGLTGRIIRTKQPLLVSDWAASGHMYSSIVQKTGSEMLSYLGVPMIFDDRVVGVLSVQDELANVYDEESQRLLEAMAAQTAMALENARLHALAQEAAQIDNLTQVYNHGRFVELVREAVDKSNTNDSQVSLIMLDIDFFKQYNDRFGHVAGDHVLALTALALKGCVREEDSVGRWGGEEFGVLLPGLSIDDAKKVARRIRHAIAELVPTDANGRSIASPTVSQGISTYPYPSRETTGLIEDADAALYYAKEHGRNQLVMFDRRGSHELIFRTGTLAPNMIGHATAAREENQYATNDLDSVRSNMHNATSTTDDLHSPVTVELGGGQ